MAENQEKELEKEAAAETGENVKTETGDAAESTEAGAEESTGEAQNAQEEESAAESGDSGEIPAEPEESEEDAGNGKTPKEKKGFFKNLKKKDPRDEKIEELTDKYRRLFAEFDNFRKRTEKEKASMYDMGVSNTLAKMLPVVDNLERGLAAIPEEDKESSVATGMDMIYKSMIKTLNDLGVEPMNCEGKEFDPNLHNAVMQVENGELESNTVAAELQKGYTYKGSVLRHAMVSVVQ